MLRVGWDGFTYDNDIDSAIWDNPLRYGPDIVGTPSQGRMALWPANTLTYLHGTGAVAFPCRGRLTGYLALGQGRRTQTCCRSRSTPRSRSRPLFAAHRAGRAEMTIAQLTFAMRPAPAASRSTRAIATPMSTPRHPSSIGPTGRCRYDSSFSQRRPSEYHSVKRVTFDADAAFEVAALDVAQARLQPSRLRLYASAIWERPKRTCSGFRSTSPATSIDVRAIYEDRQRDGRWFRPGALAEVGELPHMRHYDVANRDRQRLTLIANLTPGGIFGLNASAGRRPRRVSGSGHGLQHYDSDQYSVGFNVTPDDAYDSAASYGWENYQSAAAFAGC